MKIALLPNLTRDTGGKITKDICDWLRKYGAEYACQEEDRSVFADVPLMDVLPPSAETAPCCGPPR